MIQDRYAHFQYILTFIIFSAIVFCGCGLPAVLTGPIPQSAATLGFYIIAYFAQNFLFAVLLGMIVFPVVMLTRSTILRAIIITPLATAIFLFAFVDSKVFSFWRIFISGNLMGMYFSKAGRQIADVNADLYTWLAYAIVMMLLVTVIVLWLSHRLQTVLQSVRWFVVGVLLYVTAQVGFIFFVHDDNIFVSQSILTIPYFYELSWVKALQHISYSVFPVNSPSEKLRVALSTHSRLNYPLHPLQYHLPKQPLNVVLIVVDSLRYDMLNPVNMPAVFHFSQQADRFVDNLSGGDCTRPGIFSLFYGIPSTYWRSALRYKEPSIILRAFQHNHYDLGIFASAPLTWPAFDDTVFADVKQLQLTTPGDTALARDITITQEMQHFLMQHAKTHHHFFAFMFYDAPHAYNTMMLKTPFHPVQFLNYFDINRHTLRTPFFNLYQNAVHADDVLIAKILTLLQQEKLLQNTVVVITADHGQEFNDNHNNYWEHASGFSKYQMRTPMIIAWPNKTPKIFTKQTTHFDLAPTLLKRVLGVSNPVQDYSVGDDFFSKKQPAFVLASNYQYFALITRQEVTEFHHSGLYRMTDSNMHALHHVFMNQKRLAEMLQQMRRFQ